MHEYALYMNAEQAHIIETALDFYARVIAGQTEEIAYHLTINRDDLSHDDKIILKAFCSAMRKHIHTNFNGFSDQIYDIMQAIRYKMAWEEEPSGGTSVRFYKPIFKSGDTPIKVERLEKQF